MDESRTRATFTSSSGFCGERRRPLPLPLHLLLFLSLLFDVAQTAVAAKGRREKYIEGKLEDQKITDWGGETKKCCLARMAFKKMFDKPSDHARSVCSANLYIAARGGFHWPSAAAVLRKWKSLKNAFPPTTSGEILEPERKGEEGGGRGGRGRIKRGKRTGLGFSLALSCEGSFLPRYSPELHEKDGCLGRRPVCLLCFRLLDLCLARRQGRQTAWEGRGRGG